MKSVTIEKTDNAVEEEDDEDDEDKPQDPKKAAVAHGHREKNPLVKGSPFWTTKE